MEKYGVQFSQIDAAYPLSGKDGPLHGVPYVMKAIAWAAQVGSPRVDTTDGLNAPPGLKDEEAMDLMKRSYQQIIEVAEAHRIIVNIEPHGYFTTKPEFMGRMLDFCDQPLSADELRLGQHVHRRPGPGGLPRPVYRSGEPRSRKGRFRVAGGGHPRQTDRHRRQSLRLGEGVNAENIKRCLALLRDHGYDGVLSMECEGQGGPMIERSLAWLRAALAELKFNMDEFTYRRSF